MKVKDSAIHIRVSQVDKNKIKNSGLKYSDVTCPFVKRIHNTVKEKSESGLKIIIVGNAKHPEVEGIMGWSKSQPITIESIEDVEKGLENNLPIDMIEMDIKNIWEELGKINGTSYEEELLDEMFSRFCLGK